MAEVFVAGSLSTVAVRNIYVQFKHSLNGLETANVRDLNLG